MDPHPPTRTQVEELAAAALAGNDAASQSLEKLFSASIQFGTAGMRGAMEAGSAGLNYVTALQMAQGTCSMLLTEAASKQLTAADLSVVVGFDHRSNASNGINSKSIATVISSAFLSRGVRVHLFADFCHTPLVPFTVQALAASAGIMVTASHNPKLDNGIKVYVHFHLCIFGDCNSAPSYNALGCQSSSLECERIQQHIKQNAQPWPGAEYSTFDSVLMRHAALLPPQPLLSDMQQRYIDAMRRTLSRYDAAVNARSGVAIVCVRT